MTDATLVRRTEHSPVISQLEKLIPGDLLARIQSGTGQAEVMVAEERRPSVSALLTSWERAMKAATSHGWHLAAEELFDEVEEGEVEVGDTDVAFLIQMATDPKTNAVSANTAIRLMGMLAEESLVPRDEVLPKLRDLLVHDDAGRVYYAIKALWQARDRGAAPALKKLLDGAPSVEVASILQRAIAVLE
jgi:hypothetical protein